MQEIKQENKMGTMHMTPLLLSMSVPIMISMLVQALYNIVDSVFVAQYSEKALTAVSLTFPVQSLMIAFGVGTGVGMNSLLSRRLGQKLFDEANDAAKQGLFLAVITAVVFAILGAACAPFFFRPFTEDAEVIRMGEQYMIICTTLSFGMFVQIMGERILQGTGRAVHSMITQGVGAVINIILDPIMIFGMGFIPEMGISGAALATVIGQIAAMILAIVFNAKYNSDISISMRRFRPKWRMIRDIYAVGFPSIIMQSVTSVLTVGVNKILASDMAISVFGIYFKLQSFIFMPVFGLTNGLIPVIGYNYGARHKERITHAVKLALVWGVCIMLAGFAVFQIFPDALLRMFKASDDMMIMGRSALKFLSIAFIFAGFGIVLSSVFQALGNGIFSLIISLTRQLIVILPAAYIMSRFFNETGVWLAFPLAELVSMPMAVIMYIYLYRKKIKTL